MNIREITAEERPKVSSPIEEYAFRASPAADRPRQEPSNDRDLDRDTVTLVAEEDDGAPLATASAVPMRQNVRGVVYPMAGIAGVATMPLARRRGYARALVTQLLNQMRDTGHVVSALYPFRPSFYERFGFVGLPRTRTVTFAPEGAAGLRADLPGEVTCVRSAAGYPAYREFTERLLVEQHGFSVLPESMAVGLRDADDRWLVMAHSDGEPVGALTYRISGHGGVMAADHMLTRNALGRALLLGFVARHVDQVREVELRVAPGEFPELWATDFAAVTQAVTSFPAAAAPMARVLSLSGLAGMPAGRERVVVEVVKDPYIAGSHVLDGRSGSLEVMPGAGAGAASEATLTAAGLSALVYGVADPDDLVVRGLADISGDAAARLRVLFPQSIPYLYSAF